MAAANESQGLKIAVAAFVTLTVILAVTSYFLYSAYSRSEASSNRSRTRWPRRKKPPSNAVNQYNEFRQMAGVRAEEFDPAKAEVDRRSSRRMAIGSTPWRPPPTPPSRRPSRPGPMARTSRTPGPRPDDHQLLSERAQQELHVHAGPADRAAGEHHAARHRDVLQLRGPPEGPGIDDQRGQERQIDVQAKAAADSKADLEAEHNKHESERQIAR